MREDEEKGASLSLRRHLHTEQTEGGTDHRGRLYLTDGESLKMRKRRQTEKTYYF